MLSLLRWFFQWHYLLPSIWTLCQTAIVTKKPTHTVNTKFNKKKTRPYLRRSRLTNLSTKTETIYASKNYANTGFVVYFRFPEATQAVVEQWQEIAGPRSQTRRAHPSSKSGAFGPSLQAHQLEEHTTLLSRHVTPGVNILDWNSLWFVKTYS